MNEKITPAMKDAVKEYYAWHNEKSAHAVKILKSINGFTALLARVTDENGDKISTLMSFVNWADGHADVTEFEYRYREHEKQLVEAFEAGEFD